MDDVIRHVVLARRDKDLLAGYLVGPIVLRLCFGAHQAQIGAAMWLSQVHGAGPLTADHVWQIGGFLFLGAMRKDRRGRAVGQTLIHGEGLVRAREELAHRAADDRWHILPAEFLGHVQTGPAAFFHHFKGVFEAFGRIDHTVFQTAALFVAYNVQGREDFAGQFAGLFEDGICEIRV